jgi:hexosaminidase
LLDWSSWGSGQVAQSVERSPEKAGVGGSIPSLATIFVEPNVLTPGELRQLTDYGLRYHVQLTPHIGPAHIACILKHPEFERLRAFHQSNCEICTINPDSYKLLEGMYQELMDANKGVKYFLLSTDEPYYIGLANNAQCNEADETKKLGDVGKVLAEFIKGCRVPSRSRSNRNVLGRVPAQARWYPALPAYLINGEVYGPEFDRAFDERGVRQMIFTYTQASEPLFPNYYLLPESEQVNSSGASQADEAHFRPTADPISQMFNEISFWGARNTADMMGLDVCAWRDEGLHPETLSVRICNRGWMDLAPGSPDPAEAKSSPCRLFYGRAATNIDRLYWWAPRPSSGQAVGNECLSPSGQFCSPCEDRQHGTENVEADRAGELRQRDRRLTMFIYCSQD